MRPAGNALDNAIEAAGVPGNGESPSLQGGQGTLHAAGGEHPGRRGAADLATTKTDKAAHGFGIPGMREIAERYGGTLDAGSGTNGFELGGVPAPGRAGRNTVNPHALTAAADTGESSIFHICGVFAQKNREAVQWTSPCSAAKADSKHLQKFDLFPGGPVKNQFSNPPKVLGHHAFSAVWKVSTPAARRSAAAWSTSST